MTARKQGRPLARIAVIVLAAMAAGAAVLAFYGWLTLLSPFLYHPPQELAAIDSDRPHRVFAYGTLRQPLVRWLVVGDAVPAREAVLPGYTRQGLDISPREGGETEGVIFTVDASQLRRLDRYERLGIRYRRMEVVLEDGRRAWVYQRRDSSE